MSKTDGKTINIIMELLFLIPIGKRIKNAMSETNLVYLILMPSLWTLVFILVVINLVYKRDENVMDRSVHALSDLVFFLFSVIFVNINLNQREDYCYVYKNIEEGLYQYEIPVIEDSQTIKYKYMRPCKIFLYSMAFLNITSFLAKFAVPFYFGVALIMHPNDDMDNLPLPYSCWCPFSLNYLPTYFFVYLIVFIPAGFSALMYLSLFSLEFLSITNVICEIEILTSSLRCLIEKARALAEQPPSRRADPHRVDECFRILANQVIQHHQKIITYIRRINSLFGMVVFVVVNATCATNTVTSYRISMEPNLTTSTNLSHIGLILGGLLAIWLYSFMGQLVLDAGEDLRNALYDANWEDFPKSFTKDLLIMEEMLKRPLCLKFAGIYVLRLETFTTVCQATYSYFNVLRSLRFT